MKPVRYTPEAARDLKRHANMAARIRDKMRQYAANPAPVANNVKDLAGSNYKRLRVGGFRVIFQEFDTEIVVIRAGATGQHL